MAGHVGSIRIAVLAGSMVAAAIPTVAADVTPDRLVNADKEPQNWLMNHRTYDGQRFSPLARINKDNVKNLKLAYAVPLGGGAGNEFVEATPLAEDGFLYITDSWGVLYKIDGTSGDVGRIVWRMDPKQEQQGQQSRRGACGAISSLRPPTVRRVIIATDKETGKVVWETHVRRHRRACASPSAPLAIKDKIIVGAANGDAGRARLDRRRSMPRPASGCGGSTPIPAPGEPGSETWKDNNNAWQTGGGAVWVTGTYDPGHQPDHLGHRQPGADVRSDLPSGRQSLHQQRDLLGSRHRQDELVLPVHARRHVGLRRGRHPHPDRRRGRRPAAQADHALGAQRLRLHDGPRTTAQIVGAKPYMDNINWTKGIDQKTGKPLDYDPSKDIQTYAGIANHTPSEPLQEGLPVDPRRQQLLAVLLQSEDQADLYPGPDGVRTSRIDTDKHSKDKGWNGGTLPDRRPLRKQPHCRRSRSPARSRRTSTCHIRTTAARWRPAAVWSSSVCSTAPSRRSTTPRSTSCGRSMSAPASRRRP